MSASRMPAAGALLLLLVLVSHATPAAQQTPPPAAPQAPATAGSEPQAPSEATFRAGTSAVVLDVVVRDQRGRPVTDLRADEIEVRENGRRVPVESFAFVRGGAPTGQAATMPDPLRRLTLITLVFEPLTQNGRDLARRAALAFLDGPRPPDQWVSVFRLDERLRRVAAFTQDAAVIRNAIQSATAAAGRESADRQTGAGETAIEQQAREAESTTRQIGGGAGATADQAAIGVAAGDAATAAVLQRMQVLIERAQAEQRGQSSLYPLMALIKAHATLEGRKALLLFSEGLSVPATLEEAFRATVSEANRAGVSIYAVDARGLDPARALDAARQTLDRVGRNSQRQMVTRGSLPVTIEDVMTAEDAEGALRSDSQGTLQLLAEETGGFLVANSNDLGARLERVSSDLDAYYEIAYQPPDARADGRFREVDVKVKRRGVTVQSRSGYFAMPDTAGLPILPYELPMLAAAEASPAPSPFPVSVAAFRFGPAATPPALQHTIVVEVPLRHLTFDEDHAAGRYTLRVAVMAIVRDSDGAVVERLSESYPLEGALERVEGLRQGRLVFRRQLDLPPGRYELQAIARDQQTERDSVTRVALDVPVVRRGVARLSALSIIRRVEHAGDAPDLGDDPFRSAQLRVVPNLDVPISKASNRQVSAYVVVYPGEGVLPSLTFEFVHEGAIVGQSVAALDPPDASGVIKYVASFPTDPFAPGTYRLRAVLQDGSHTDVSETGFWLVP